MARDENDTRLLAATELAAQYGLDVASARWHNYKVVRLDTGSGSFALRRYNPGVSRVQVEAIQMMVTILAGEGCPVVAPIRTLDGRTMIEWEHCFAELLPWIEHTEDGRSSNSCDVIASCSWAQSVCRPQLHWQGGAQRLVLDVKRRCTDSTTQIEVRRCSQCISRCMRSLREQTVVSSWGIAASRSPHSESIA